jgi:mercuric ion transport protein
MRKSCLAAPGDVTAEKQPMTEVARHEAAHSGFWQHHLDQLGIGGSLFAALCCLGFPALLSILSAVGLSFLVNDAILIPLLIVFLAVTLFGLYLGMQHHHRPAALVLGLVSAVVTLVFIALATNTVLAAIGIAGLIAASILNVWLRSRQLRSS